jgi:hypothetical protein
LIRRPLIQFLFRFQTWIELHKKLYITFICGRGSVS